MSTRRPTGGCLVQPQPLGDPALSPQQFVSWDSLGGYIVDVLRNPVQLVTVVLAVLAVFIDPTTAGISDSAQALRYTCPKKSD